MNDNYDVIIVGAGPAGCGLALALALTDLKIALIDRSDFPRRKVCGGALSERALNRLKEFPEQLNLFQNFIVSVNKTDSYGMRIYAPSLKVLEFDYKEPEKAESAPGFICERSEFDNFMLDEVRKNSNITVIMNTSVKDITVSEDGVKVFCGNNNLEAKFIVGADGANSVAARCLSKGKMKQKKDAGISAHFENVTGFHENNLIDIYFLKETVPGYFWIFKLPDGKANSGLYMPAERIIKDKINLKALFEEIKSKYPGISERFIKAGKLDEPQGGILPMNIGGLNSKCGLYGDRYLLIGDAAGLIDPITGEGIGNALSSAVYASTAIKRCFEKNDFSEKTLGTYGDLMRKKFKKELFIRTCVRNLVFSNALVLDLSLKFIKTFSRINCMIRHKLYKG